MAASADQGPVEPLESLEPLEPDIRALAGLLRAAGLDPSAGELADALWLAGRTRTRARPVPAGPDPVRADPDRQGREDPGEPPPAPPRREEPETEDPVRLYAAGPRHGAEGDPDAEIPLGGGVPVRVPGAAALPRILDVQRALRALQRHRPPGLPVRTVLDEAATAEASARAPGLVIPVLRPETRREATVRLVMDASPSMAVWQEMFEELRSVCERLGAFRDVQAHYLHRLADGTAAVGRGPSPAAALRSGDQLRDPTGRALTMVVSDCTGPVWREGEAQRLLHRWAECTPCVIVQPLPQRLWNRSWLPTERGVLEHAEGGGGAVGGGLKLRFRPDRPPRPGRPTGGLTVPVLPPHAAALGAWARLVAGLGTGPVPAEVGRVLARHPAAPVPLPRTARPPRELVSRFRASAAPGAVQLAVYLAAAPLTLPVMRLVQRTMLPDSEPSDLAEVLLGGLLRRSGEPRGTGTSSSPEYRTCCWGRWDATRPPWCSSTAPSTYGRTSAAGCATSPRSPSPSSPASRRTAPRTTPAGCPPGGSRRPSRTSRPRSYAATCPVPPKTTRTPPARARPTRPRRPGPRAPGRPGPPRGRRRPGPVRGRRPAAAGRGGPGRATGPAGGGGDRAGGGTAAAVGRPAGPRAPRRGRAGGDRAGLAARPGGPGPGAVRAGPGGRARPGAAGRRGPGVRGGGRRRRPRPAPGLRRAAGADPDPAGRAARGPGPAVRGPVRAGGPDRPGRRPRHGPATRPGPRARPAGPAAPHPGPRGARRPGRAGRRTPVTGPHRAGRRAGRRHGRSHRNRHRNRLRSGQRHRGRAPAETPAARTAHVRVELAEALRYLPARLEEAAGQLARALGEAAAEPDARLAALLCLARVHRARYARDADPAALDGASEAYGRARGLISRDGEAFAELLPEWGDVLLERTRAADGRRFASTAVRVLRESRSAVPQSDPGAAHRLRRLATGLRLRHAYEGDLVDLREAEYLLELAVRQGHRPLERARAWRDHGDVQQEIHAHTRTVDRLDRAADSYRRAWRAALEAGQDERQDTALRLAARVQEQRGEVLERLARPRAALDAYRAALELRRRLDPSRAEAPEAETVECEAAAAGAAGAAPAGAPRSAEALTARIRALEEGL